MYITLLFVAAFLFFIADRKIRWSSLFGMFTVVLACLPLANDMIYITNDTMFFYKGILKKLGFRANLANLDRFRIIFAVLLSLVLILFLMVIAKLWSRELFTSLHDGQRYEKFADEVRYYNWILRLFRTSFYDSGKLIFYGVALLLVAILPLFLIIIKKLPIKKLNLPSEEGSASSYGCVSSESAFSPALSTVGIAISLFAILCFITIAATAYPANKHLSLLFYDHYHLHHDYSAILCTIVLLSLLAGAVFLILGLIRIIRKKQIRKYAFTFCFSVALMLIALGDFLFLLRDAIRFIRS